MYTFQFRRGLAQEWLTKDPILRIAEPGVETDTGKMKLGDGLRTWSNLPYLVPTPTPTPPPEPGTKIVLLNIGEEPPNPPAANTLYLRRTSSGPVLDTIVPSTPSELLASNIDVSSFAVSWSPATDNVGVAGYELSIDLGLPIPTNGTSYSFVSLDPETTYSVRVRALDYAGNPSLWSQPLSVSTLANTNNETYASVFGTNPWPDVVTGHSDGPTEIVNAFYGTGSSSFIVRGLRLYLPAGLPNSFYETNVETMFAVLSETVENPPSFDVFVSNRTFSPTMVAPLVPGWNEILLADPVEVQPYSSGADNVIWAGVRYQSGPNYLHAARTNLPFDAVASLEKDTVHLAEQNFPRSGNKFTGLSSHAGPYPIDILVEP